MGLAHFAARCGNRRRLGAATLAGVAVVVCGIAASPGEFSALASAHTSAGSPRPLDSRDARVAHVTELNRRIGELARDVDGVRTPAALASRIRSLASDRLATLSAIALESPDVAQRLLLGEDLRDRAGSIAPGLIEKTATLSGVYTTLAAGAPSGPTGYTHQLRSGGATYTLVSPGAFPPVVSGSEVKATGDVLGGTVLLEASGSTATAPVVVTGATGVVAGMTGPTPVAVILATFSDTTTAPTIAAEQAAFMGSGNGNDVDSWYAQASYGQTYVVPSFFGPFALNETSSTGCASTSSLAQAIINAAAPAVTFANFTRLVFIVDCASVAGLATVGTTSVSTPLGAVTAGEAWIGPSAWTDLHTLVHELGHNAGLFHADWVICQPDTFDAPTRLGPNCTAAPYGDPFDVMGTPGHQTPHFDAYHTAAAGWFTAANYPTVTAAGTSTFTIAPIETVSAGVMALNIPRGNTGTSWTVEYRQPVGPDAWMSTCGLATGCNVTAGASIKINGTFPGSSEDTHAVDMTPGSQPLGFSYWPTQDLEVDGALLPGRSFTDPELGIVISVTSAAASGVTVQVTIPSQACTRAAPSVTLPSQSYVVAPGAAVSTTLTLVDNDGAGCPAQRFKYSGPGYADPGLVTLSPGGSATMNVTYTPPSLGYTYYAFNPTVVPDSLASSVTSRSATLQVSGPSDTTAPSAPMYLSAQAWGSATAALHWAPSSDAVGIAYYNVYRDGTLVGTAPGCSYIDTSAAGSSHSYAVTSVNDGRVESPPSQPATVTMPAATDTVAPSSPGNMVATAVLDHALTLRWDAASDNVGVAYYQVSGGPNGSVLVDASSTSVTFTGLPSSTLETLYVTAFDGAGNQSSFWTAYSAAAMPTTAASGTVAPPPPSPLLLTGYGLTHASLSWQPSAGASGVTGYTLYRNSLKLATVTGTTYTDTAIDNCGNCQYTVTAVDAAGNVSAQTATVSASGGSSSGPSVAIMSPSSGTTLSSSVTETATASASSGITSVSFYVDSRFIGASAASPYGMTLDPQWTGNGSHSLTAIARDASNDLASSAPVNITTSAADTTAPTAPAVVLGYPASPTEVDLHWAAASDNVGVTAYDVYRGASRIATVTATSFADTTLASGSTVSYQIVARDAAGNASSASPAIQLTTFGTSSSPSPTPTATPAPTPTPTPSPSPTPTPTPTPSPISAPTTGAISGTVKSSHGTPLSGIAITISGGGASVSTTTSSSGAFLVGNLPAGTYTVVASSRFSSATVSATVTAGTTTTVAISIRR